MPVTSDQKKFNFREEMKVTALTPFLLHFLLPLQGFALSLREAT